MVIDKGNAKSSLKIVIVIVFLSSETYRKSNVTFKDGMIDHEPFLLSWLLCGGSIFFEHCSEILVRDLHQQVVALGEAAWDRLHFPVVTARGVGWEGGRQIHLQSVSTLLHFTNLSHFQFYIMTLYQPFWAHLDPFWPFQTKIIFLPQMDKVGFGGGTPEQKINFCLKWSKRVQMGPKGS